MKGGAVFVLAFAASVGVSAGLSQTATSVITGIVVTDGSSPQPVSRALVTISAAELRVSQSALTDGAGAFAFANLPAGRFTLSVSKPAFITTAYGARRVGRPGTPVAVAAGQRVTDLSVVLPRGAVVSGTIRDELGEPISGAQVSAIPLDQLARMPPMGPMMSASGAFLTDDRGGYRVFGLAPGDYVVMARIRTAGLGSEAGRMTEAQVDAALRELQAARGRMSSGRAAAPASTTRLRDDPTYSFAPMYFPGTSNAAAASPVTLSPGEERAGLDFLIRPVTTSTVEGIVTNPNGPLPSVSLSLDPLAGPAETNSFIAQAGLLTAAPTVSADGRFKLANTAPGRYRLYARSSNPPLWAAADVSVTGEKIQGLSLVLQPALSVSGRLEFNGTLAPPLDLTALRVTWTGIGGVRGPTPPSAAVRADGSFQTSGIMPGVYRPSIGQASAGWWLRSAIVNGKDALDAGVEFGTAGNVAGAVFTFTDRHSELSGTLQTPAGSPASNYFVVAFPTERAFWLPQARRVRSTVPATDGRFAIQDLPGGEYFLAALTDVQPSDLDSPSFLAEIVAAALRVSVVDGEKRSQDLRIAR